MLKITSFRQLMKLSVLVHLPKIPYASGGRNSENRELKLRTDGNDSFDYNYTV